MSKIIFAVLLFAIFGLAIYFFRKNAKNQHVFLGNTQIPYLHLIRCMGMGFLFMLAERFIFRFFICKLFYNQDLMEFTIRLHDVYSAYPQHSNFATWGRILFSALVIGLFLKEGLKLFAFIYATKKYKLAEKASNQKIIYAMAIALGFAFGDILFHYYVDMLPYKIAHGDFIGLKLNLIWVVVKYICVHLFSGFILGAGYAIATDNTATNAYFMERTYLVNLPSFIQFSKQTYLYIAIFFAALLHAVLATIFIVPTWPLLIPALVLVIFLYRVFRKIGLKKKQ